MSDAEIIVEALLNPPVRACAECEQEKGILDRSDYSKSHGQCRRHFVEFARANGASEDEINDILAETKPDAWAPEL